MSEEYSELFRMLQRRVLDPMRAASAVMEAHTAVLRELQEEIRGYTDRGEAAPPELLEVANRAMEMAADPDDGLRDDGR